MFKIWNHFPKSMNPNFPSVCWINGEQVTELVRESLGFVQVNMLCGWGACYGFWSFQFGWIAIRTFRRIHKQWLWRQQIKSDDGVSSMAARRWEKKESERCWARGWVISRSWLQDNHQGSPSPVTQNPETGLLPRMSSSWSDSVANRGRATPVTSPCGNLQALCRREPKTW